MMEMKLFINVKTLSLSPQFFVRNKFSKLILRFTLRERELFNIKKKIFQKNMIVMFTMHTGRSRDSLGQYCDQIGFILFVYLFHFFFLFYFLLFTVLYVQFTL